MYARICATTTPKMEKSNSSCVVLSASFIIRPGVFLARSVLQCDNRVSLWVESTKTPTDSGSKSAYSSVSFRSRWKRDAATDLFHVHGDDEQDIAITRTLTALLIKVVVCHSFLPQPQILSSARKKEQSNVKVKTKNKYALLSVLDIYLTPWSEPLMIFLLVRTSFLDYQREQRRSVFCN